MPTGPETAREVAAVIADEIAALSRRAREAELDMLAYLLACARLEAVEQSRRLVAPASA
jgi:hypothetical protein